MSVRFASGKPLIPSLSPFSLFCRYSSQAKSKPNVQIFSAFSHHKIQFACIGWLLTPLFFNIIPIGFSIERTEILRKPMSNLEIIQKNCWLSTNCFEFSRSNHIWTFQTFQPFQHFGLDILFHKNDWLNYFSFVPYIRNITSFVWSKKQHHNLILMQFSDTQCGCTVVDCAKLWWICIILQ